MMTPESNIRANRRERRLLLRRGKTGEQWTTFADNKGFEYDYKSVAKFASLCNFILGGLKRGFPVLARRLHYPAWACYPFFFVKRDLKVKDPIPILNHERIHVVQQRELHTIISFPLAVISAFTTLWLLMAVPFVPTIVYMADYVRVWFKLSRMKRAGETKYGKITAQVIRANTCFELEATSKAPNANYLLERKFMAELAWTGWKIFRNYGK